MRIGIIGAGAMARALGSGWAAAGHDIVIGARNQERAAETAAAIGHQARAVSLTEAANFGEATLLAVPVTALTEILAIGDFAARTLIDCTNAFQPDSGKFALTEPAVAERIAATAPKAHVVKAFNLCAAEVWESPQREFEGSTLMVPLCGDNPAAIAQVAALAEDLKLKPFHAGDLTQAKYLEATAAFIVGQWFGGHDARTMFPPLKATFATTDN